VEEALAEDWGTVAGEDSAMAEDWATVAEDGSTVAKNGTMAEAVTVTENSWAVAEDGSTVANDGTMAEDSWAVAEDGTVDNWGGVMNRLRDDLGVARLDVGLNVGADGSEVLGLFAMEDKQNCSNDACKRKGRVHTCWW